MSGLPQVTIWDRVRSRVCCCLPSDKTNDGEMSHLLGTNYSLNNSSSEEADRLWRRGVELHSRGETAEAVEAFRKAVRLEPRRCDLLLHLGTALQDSYQLDDAAACYRKILDQLDSKNHSALYNLGYIYEEQGKYSEAISHFKSALNLAPRDTDALVNIGNCHMQTGDLDQAISAYRAVISLNPNCAIGHYNLGSALHAQRKLSLAASHFQNTIALEPNYADAHFNLGIVYQEQAQPALALQSYDHAYILDPNLTDAKLAADAIRGAAGISSPGEEKSSLVEQSSSAPTFHESNGKLDKKEENDLNGDSFSNSYHKKKNGTEPTTIEGHPPTR
uniref:UDP-N-acetylglucosamine--peptide N-acetylglucosaminyltransferase SPINDLY n=1 Tax=Aureoumbra lagunensis TaxID=44058 RepID=A0A7S3NPU3_9STRA